VKYANEQTDALCFARFVPRTQDGVWKYRQRAQLAIRQPNALCNIPLTACFQPATQPKLQASATYLSDACAGTGHVADPLATHWLMFRSRVDRRYWSTLVVAPKCSMIKREEAVMWLKLFIACNKAVRSASKSYTRLLEVKRVKREIVFLDTFRGRSSSYLCQQQHKHILSRHLLENKKNS